MVYFNRLELSLLFIFIAHIGNELKAHPPSMTFQEAVDNVAMRTKLLRSASENTTVSFDDKPFYPNVNLKYFNIKS